MIQKKIIICIFVSLLALAAIGQTARTMPDKEQLEIALDYFSSSKYREALTLLTKLDKKYKLNPRFKAYIGVCHYYEWNYKEACRYLDTTIKDIEVYAPHERSIYYFTDAESHFFLEEYEKAIPLYEKMLNVCFNNEKGDAFFRLGFCYLQINENKVALDNLNSALLYYEKFGYSDDKKARIVQIKKKIEGLKK